MFRRAALVLLVFTLCEARAAEKPVLDQIYPAGIVRGATNEVTLLGKFELWPPKAWTSTAGLDFQFTTNKGKAQVVVSPDAKVGPCLIRLFNDAGPSDLRMLVVTESPELLETEPNNHFAKAQVVTNFPVTINGRLEKNGDVDSFQMALKGGQWLDARVDCYTLMAKLDPVLRLVTTNGYQLAWNHDFGSLDPRLIWQAPYDLTAVLQIFGFAYPADSDIRLSGGSADVYRLHIAIADRAPVDLHGPITEHEPNNSTNNAAEFAVGTPISGVIDPAGDVDRYRLELHKDQWIAVRVAAAALGSPLDPWLAIENASGKELTRNDDADNSSDARLEWKAPEEGSYLVTVGSVTHQGAPDFRYELTAQTLEPDFKLVSNSDALLAAAGTTNSLKMSFKRLRGFTNELALVATNLPAGIQAEQIALPTKDGEVSLSFNCPTNMPAFNGPFQVVAIDKSSGGTRKVPFELVSRTENNGVPGGYSKLLVESTDQLWLTVKPSEPKAAADPK